MTYFQKQFSFWIVVVICVLGKGVSHVRYVVVQTVD